MWPQLLAIVPSLLDKIFPDQSKAAEAKARLLELQLSGELEQIKGQLEINKAEAGSGNWFVAGWRPFIGWVCGMALAFQYLVRPIVLTKYPALQVPGLDDNLWQLMLGMLGMGGLRTFEKAKGVSK